MRKLVSSSATPAIINLAVPERASFSTLLRPTLVPRALRFQLVALNFSSSTWILLNFFRLLQWVLDSCACQEGIFFSKGLFLGFNYKKWLPGKLAEQKAAWLLLNMHNLQCKCVVLVSQEVWCNELGTFRSVSKQSIISLLWKVARHFIEHDGGSSQISYFMSCSSSFTDFNIHASPLCNWLVLVCIKTSTSATCYEKWVNLYDWLWHVRTREVNVLYYSLKVRV